MVVKFHLKQEYVLKIDTGNPEWDRRIRQGYDNMPDINVKQKRMSRRKIRMLRTWIRQRFGDNCYWCGEPMLFGGINKDNIEDLATIEHHIAIKQGQPNNVNLFVLAHKRCNK